MCLPLPAALSCGHLCPARRWLSLATLRMPGSFVPPCCSAIQYGRPPCRSVTAARRCRWRPLAALSCRTALQSSLSCASMVLSCPAIALLPLCEVRFLRSISQHIFRRPSGCLVHTEEYHHPSLKADVLHDNVFNGHPESAD